MARLFVFQFHHLLPEFTAHENVMMPLLIRGENTRDAGVSADRLLEQVGLSDRAEHLPSELSGGEGQRVAVARALVTEPSVVLADEPSGNLDHDTGEQEADLLFDLVGRTGMTMVLVTHNSKLASRCSKQLTLSQGLLH